MLRAALQRPVSLRATGWHGLYCSAITALHMYPHQILGALGAPEGSIDGLLAYVQQNATIMTGCTSFLATALFLMVSFRINRAVSRWWDGRRLYGQLLGEARALVHTGCLYHNEKPEGVQTGLLTSAYVRCVEAKLRDESDEAHRHFLAPLLSPAELETVMASQHRPNCVMQLITRQLREVFESGKVKGIRALVAQHAVVERMLVNMEGIEVISSTPEPWSYQKHLRLTTQLWLTIMPLALLPSLHLATPILGTAIGFVVIKLDDVGIEVQNPFGLDKSDLSICLLTDQFQQQIQETLINYVDEDLPSEAVLQRKLDELDRQAHLLSEPDAK